MYSGALEFQDFPNSIAIANTAEEKYPDRYFSKEVNFYSQWLQELNENPLPVLRNYLYKVYRVWVPMSNSGIAGFGEALSGLYGSIVLVLFIFGICLLIKKNLIHNYYYLLIPVFILWGQQILLHTESRYMLLARIAECLIAGYSLSFITKKITTCITEKFKRQ